MQNFSAIGAKKSLADIQRKLSGKYSWQMDPAYIPNDGESELPSKIHEIGLQKITPNADVERECFES